MGSFEETFKGLLARYLRETEGWDVVEVISYEQATESGGYCTTCAYEEEVMEFNYRTSSGSLQFDYIYTDFGTLIRSLSDFDQEGE